MHKNNSHNTPQSYSVLKRVLPSALSPSNCHVHKVCSWKCDAKRTTFSRISTRNNVTTHSERRQQTVNSQPVTDGWCAVLPVVGWLKCPFRGMQTDSHIFFSIQCDVRPVKWKYYWVMLCSRVANTAWPSYRCIARSISNKKRTKPLYDTRPITSTVTRRR